MPKPLLGMGCTALYDAVGATIHHVGKRLADMEESERPGKVLFVVTTDGYENASHNYSKEQVKAMIQHQSEKYSWEFIFLGANINAEETASSIGIKADQSFNYVATAKGVSNVYAAVSDIALSYSASAADCTLDSLTALYKDTEGCFCWGDKLYKSGCKFALVASWVQKECLPGMRLGGKLPKEVET